MKKIFLGTAALLFIITFSEEARGGRVSGMRSAAPRPVTALRPMTKTAAKPMPKPTPRPMVSVKNPPPVRRKPNSSPKQISSFGFDTYYLRYEDNRMPPPEGPFQNPPWKFW